MRALPTPQQLREVLDYNHETGGFLWRARCTGHFVDGVEQSAERKCLAWNSRWAGRPAFTALDGKGYLRGNVFSRGHFAHRIAWAHYYFEWPVAEIDHINGLGTDNRIVNLRVVVGTLNKRNMKLRRDNTSGCPGVKLTRNNTWAASIGVGGWNRWLGAYETFDEAVAARRAAEITLGYTSRYAAHDPCPSPE